MVEINNKTEAQFVFYPKTQRSTGPYTLHIHSELSQKDWYFEDVEDKASLHDYYKFYIDYRSVDDGEFNYFILENEEVMDTGLMRIGIGKANARGYDTPNEIIQYDMYAEPTERYEDKDVTITENGEYTITPDEGYNAIAQVNLTVEVSCDDAYNSGYTDGYESGRTDGYTAGYDSGRTDGYAEGYESGRTDGYTDGFNDGYMAGYEAGSEACGRDYLTIHNTSSQPTTVDITPSSVLEGTFEFRKTGGVWTTISGYTRVTLENGEKVEFRGDNPQYSEDYSNNTNIRVFGGSAEVYGNVMSLIADADEFPSGSDYNFCGLFQNSYALTDASNLSLPSGLTQGCYQNMFKGCNTLTGTPELNATQIVQSCYEGMFEGCSSLTTAPDMPGQNLAKYGYKRMFANCGSLRNNIPASLPGDLAYYGSCYEMFLNCTSLTTAPALPATEIHGSAYMNMFKGCSSLTTAPELPATILTSGPDDIGEETTGITHYSGMFWDCTGLTTAPAILPATGTLPGSCYSHMFQGCTSLTTAPILPAEDQGSFAYGEMFRGCSNLNYVKCLSQNTNNTRDWLNGVAETGTFVKDANTTWQRGPSAIPVGWWVEDDNPDYSAMPLTFEFLNNGTLFFKSEYNGQAAGQQPLYRTIQYSLNGGDWSSITSSVGQGTPIVVQAGDILQVRGNNANYSWADSYFVKNNFFSVSSGCSFNVYGNAMSLINSTNYQNLEEFTASHALAGLFKGNSGLLSAENLVLPATGLTSSCYATMFTDCINLTTAPELPATILERNCYAGMFYTCKSLIKAPELPATTLMPTCYARLFRECTSLHYVKCMATDVSARNCLQDWFLSAATTGTFVKAAGVEWTRGTSGIPDNWTVQDAE